MAAAWYAPGFPLWAMKYCRSTPTASSKSRISMAAARLKSRVATTSDENDEKNDIFHSNEGSRHPHARASVRLQDCHRILVRSLYCRIHTGDTPTKSDTSSAETMLDTENMKGKWVSHMPIDAATKPAAMPHNPPAAHSRTETARRSLHRPHRWSGGCGFPDAALPWRPT